MAYPSLYLLLVVSIGIFIGARFAFELKLLLSASFVSLFAAALFFIIIRNRRAGLLDSLYLLSALALFLCASAAYSNFKTQYLSEDDVVKFCNREIVVIGSVSSKPSVKGRSKQWTMRVHQVLVQSDTLAARGNIRVRLFSQKDAAFPFVYGDEISIRGILTLPPKAMNNGDFDYRAYLAEKDIFSILTLAHDSLIEKNGRRHLSFFERHFSIPASERISETIEKLIYGQDAQSFVKGLLLGERSALSDEVSVAFQKTGTIHVLVISGMHIGLLILLLDIFFKRLKTNPIGKWTAFALMTGLLFAYSDITGNSPPVKRAVIMALVFELSRILERKAYPLNTLAFSILTMLALEPRDLFSPSLHLTTSAVAAIMLIYPKLSSLFSFEAQRPVLRSFNLLLKWLWESLSLTLAATIGTAPLIAYYFGSVAFLGIFANVPVVLLTSLAVYAGIPMLLFDFILPPIAAFYAVCVENFVIWSIAFAQNFSRLPFATASVSTSLPSVFAFYFVVIAILQRHHPKTRAKWTIAALIVVNIAIWLPFFKNESEKPFLIFSALGRSTSIVVHTGAETLLIDVGNRLSDWNRIEARLNAFELDAKILIQFSTHDSLVQKNPIETKIVRQDSLFLAKSFILARPAIEHCRVSTKSGVLVCSMFLSNLAQQSFFNADVLFLELRHFRENERRMLQSWLSTSKVKLLVVELAPFMTRAERKFFYRYAKGEPRIKTTERDGQLIVRRFR